MIFDRNENLKNYRGIDRNLDAAIDFLLSAELDDLAVGKTVIDGERVFIQVQDACTKDIVQGSYEYHRCSLDIQIGIQGEERILLGGNVTRQVQEYRPDIGLVQCERAAECILRRGYFALFRAGEYHMPGIAVDDSADRKIRKAVVKAAEQVRL